MAASPIIFTRRTGGRAASEASSKSRPVIWPISSISSDSPRLCEPDQVGEGDRHLVRALQPALRHLGLGHHRLADRLPQVDPVGVEQGLPQQRRHRLRGGRVAHGQLPLVDARLGEHLADHVPVRIGQARHRDADDPRGLQHSLLRESRVHEELGALRRIKVLIRVRELVVLGDRRAERLQQPDEELELESRALRDLGGACSAPPRNRRPARRGAGRAGSPRPRASAPRAGCRNPPGH